jgi:hypothetical protein
MYAPLIISSSSQNVKSAGMGTYLTSQWVTPQKYQDPLGGAKVVVPAGWGTGLSGCGCGGTCGGCGDHKHGMGDWSDPSTWGPTEWGTLAVGAAIVYMATKRRAKRR